jgi:Zn-dependent protease with chaperone function
MSGSDGDDDKPGSFSPDDWQRQPRPNHEGAPDAPESAPGSFSSADPARMPTGPTPQGPRISVPSTAELLLGIPWLFWSFGVVSWVSGLFFNGFWTVLIVVLWVLSGFAIVWPATEDYLARYFFRLRRPTMMEQQRLDAAWRAVCARADVNPQYYKLWVEESDRVNGYAMAGRSISVTRWTLNSMPPRQLQAVLAHELGHHRGGHPWAALVVFWYALPGRLAVAAVRGLFRLSVQIPALGCLVGGLILLGYGFSILGALWFHGDVLYPLLAVLPFVVPIPLAWFSRRSELNADLVAADVGYGRDTVAYLYDLQAQGEDVARRAAGWRGALYATHPSLADRIRALEHHLQVSGS